MRIGLDVSKLAGPCDGIATFTAELLRALAAETTGKGGGEHELRLYAPLGPVAPARLDEVLATRSPNVRLMESTEPADGEVDVYHSTSWIQPARYSGPSLFTCYDLTVLTQPRGHTAANRVHVLTGLLEARLADAHFLAPSRATAADLAIWLEAKAPRVHVIAPGVGARFQPIEQADAAPVLERLGLAEPFLLAVGTREPRKNLGRLIDAYRGLPAQLRRETPLAIAGRVGWLEDEAGKRVGATGDGEGAGGESAGDVRLLGHVADDDLPALYSRAAAFVYPSLAEGFGFPVLEAMACGAPVITSDRSSLPEVAGDAARLIDPTDTAALGAALREVLEDADLAARLRRAGRRRVASFSWQRTARELLALYAELAR